MPLAHYGVLAGILRRHFRDDPDDQGRWFHVHLLVEDYRCAIDVDSKDSHVGVQWKVLVVEPGPLYGGAPGFAPGFTELAREPGSGALDILRHPALAAACWTAGSYLEASAALEAVLVIGSRMLIFGQPFTHGLGVHNVHQNQGDPAGSQWWAENGIWQDGGVAVLRSDGRYDVFVSKFSTQADATDDDGHPLPAPQ